MVDPIHRTDTPNNARSGGYLISDLFGLTTKIFDPQSIAIYDKEKIVGYVSRKPTGGFTEIHKRGTYLIGLLSFFLLIAPTILVDHGNALHKNIDKFREKVKKILNGSLPLYIPREERMPKEILQRIKESFL
ncbi:MAG: hypothetical protein Q7R62_02685 [bacterium]|nr:hypothetical protein [bacterium]